MTTSDERLQRLQERYDTGQVPWDAELPPPEVVAEAAVLAPGRALDLGCGYGRASIYLAQQGWLVDGVDFIETAVAGARQRAAAAGVAAQTTFYQSEVTHLPFLTGPYQWIIDVGCMHAMDEVEVVAYCGEVRRLLAENGRYLLFAHLRNTDEVPADNDDQRWLSEAVILAHFAEGFVLDKVEHGWTQVEDRPAWRSAWFWFRRLAEG